MTEDQLALTPRVCVAELLFTTPPVLAQAARTAIVADIRASLGAVSVLRDEEGVMQLALEDYIVESDDGKKAPAMFMILAPEASGEQAENKKSAASRAASLAQSFDPGGIKVLIHKAADIISPKYGIVRHVSILFIIENNRRPI